MPSAKAVPASPAPRSLDPYLRKRNFAITPEPGDVAGRTAQGRSYVIQKHWASHLHYDFRLEHHGVLLSWAVPKGPSLDPSQKRLAIRVEDHPVRYGSFEGEIPAKQYGAGKVIVWDRGSWQPEGDVETSLEAGKLVFTLGGEKLKGRWELVRTSKSGSRQEQWILFKKRDEWAAAVAGYDVTTALPDSVISGPGAVRKAGKPAKNAPSKVAPSGEPSQRTRSGPPALVTALPASLAPQLATLAADVPVGDWLYEFKLDGYRILARVDSGKVRLFTRGGHDWTAKMSSLAREIASLNLSSGWLDGEVVVMGQDGRPDFGALQNAFDASRSADMRYFIFDVPYLNGRDLRDVPLAERKQQLEGVFAKTRLQHVHCAAAIATDGASALAAACSQGFEGIMAKRLDAPYRSARTLTWQKLKCGARQEFVVIGYTDRRNNADQIGSLVLGYYEGSTLKSAGRVGTGWTAEAAASLHDRLIKLVTDNPEVESASIGKGRWSKRDVSAVHWVEPELVAEISFAGWTGDDQIRHASFHALRTDKKPTLIRRERALMSPKSAQISRAAPAKASAAKPVRGARSIQISHAERVVDPSTGLQKMDVVRYYESVADWMLPHLKGRPVALLRAPRGITGQQFFQKHDDAQSIPGLRAFAEKLWAGHGQLLEVPDATALISAAQMNVLEFHTWNARGKKVEYPDRMIFDLDPGDGTRWKHVAEAAILLRALLRELQLEAWIKTSGGKGLHVVVPLSPRRGFAEVKAFSQALVQHLAKHVPDRFVAVSGPKNRLGRIFIDYLRNGDGQTTAAAFSARARPGLGVSMPIHWDELDGVKAGDHWTIRTASEHLSFQKTDPWVGYWQSRQTLTAAIKILKSAK